MSAPTPDKATPSSAQLRRDAQYLRMWDDQTMQRVANTLDSFAALRQQRDRLAEALRVASQQLAAMAELARTVVRPSGQVALCRDLLQIEGIGAQGARAALAELEGGAS